MKITIFGSGYVGLVSAACFSEMGNHVVCVDVDKGRVAALQRGEVPIYEPRLEPMLHENAAAGRLTFTSDSEQAVAHGAYQIIAVGTPPDEDGSADLQYVLEVAATIGRLMDDQKVIINKSTVPVGSAEKVAAVVSGQLQQRGAEVPFHVVSNPEFLKEGAAIADCMRPDRIVIGSSNGEALEKMKALYAPFSRNHEKIIPMDLRSAELTKYAANAMLATKISFMNEMAAVAEKVGADVEKVRLGIGSDSRIGYSFIYPGAGYGGSCFPKDIQALQHVAREAGYQPRILNAVEQVNRDQKGVLFEKIRDHYGADLRGRTFALWGLAFKPNTDDMRAASSRALMERLWEAGAKVRAYDPEATTEAARLYPDHRQLILADSAEDALTGADALVLVTEWKAFRSPDFGRIKRRLAQPVLFDGRNIYDPQELAQRGFTYYSIGRKRVN